MSGIRFLNSPTWDGLFRGWKFREAEVDCPGKRIAGVQLGKFFVGGCMYLWNERHHKALSEIATVSGHRYSTCRACRVPRSYVS